MNSPVVFFKCVNVQYFKVVRLLLLTVAFIAIRLMCSDQQRLKHNKSAPLRFFIEQVYPGLADWSTLEVASPPKHWNCRSWREAVEGKLEQLVGKDVPRGLELARKKKVSRNTFHKFGSRSAAF